MASSRRHACRRARLCPSVRMRQTPEHAGQTGGLPESGHGALLPREAGAVRLPGGENTVLTGGESRMAGDSFRETPCGAGFCFAVRHFCTESRLPRSFPPPDSGFPSAGEGRMWGADGWFLLERERLSALCLHRSGAACREYKHGHPAFAPEVLAERQKLWLKSAGEGRMWGADGWFLLERERLSAPCLRRSGYGISCGNGLWRLLPRKQLF